MNRPLLSIINHQRTITISWLAIYNHYQPLLITATHHSTARIPQPLTGGGRPGDARLTGRRRRAGRRCSVVGFSAGNLMEHPLGFW